MNRNLILIGIVLVLGGIVAWIQFGGNNRQMAQLEAERSFAVNDLEQIQRIFIADRRGNKTTLTRSKSGWLYNNEHPANPNAVENLLDAIGRVQMLRKPANAAVPAMVKDLATNGIKVEIYSKGKRLLKSYYVGGATPDERGTYLIMDGADQPYIGHLPGWEGNLRFRYSLVGKEWRDKTIFQATVEEIESVSIEYPTRKNKSFVVEAENGSFKVAPYYEITPEIPVPPSQASIERFLIGFRWLAAEDFRNEFARADEIRQQIPFCRITLKKKDGFERKVALHPIYPEVPASPNATTEVERYFADIENGDFMLVQNQLFKEVLWAYEYFFEVE